MTCEWSYQSMMINTRKTRKIKSRESKREIQHSSKMERGTAHSQVKINTARSSNRRMVTEGRISNNNIIMRRRRRVIREERARASNKIKISSNKTSKAVAKRWRIRLEDKVNNNMKKRRNTWRKGELQWQMLITYHLKTKKASSNNLSNNLSSSSIKRRNSFLLASRRPVIMRGYRRADKTC